jgi:hypothetical protein
MGKVAASRLAIADKAIAAFRWLPLRVAAFYCFCYCTCIGPVLDLRLRYTTMVLVCCGYGGTRYRAHDSRPYRQYASYLFHRLGLCRSFHRYRLYRQAQSISRMRAFHTCAALV